MSNALLLSLRDTIFTALYRARKDHMTLGGGGKNFAATNQFGDQSMFADIRAEASVIDVLRNAYARGVLPSMRVFSEEHGTFVIGNKNDVQVTVWLDGLDGSTVYRKATLEEIAAGVPGYGTMIACAFGDNPTYDDVVLSALMRHSSGELLFRVGGGNTRLRNIVSGDEVIVEGRHSSRLEPEDIIYTDGGYSPRVQEMIDVPLIAAGRTPAFTSTTSGNTFNVVTGRLLRSPDGTTQTAVAVIEEIDKGGLEMPAMFHLAIGANGGMYGMDGLSLGPQVVATYGLDGESRIFVLANPLIAGAIFNLVSTN